MKRNRLDVQIKGNRTLSGDATLLFSFFVSRLSVCVCVGGGGRGAYVGRVFSKRIEIAPLLAICFFKIRPHFGMVRSTRKAIRSQGYNHSLKLRSP